MRKLVLTAALALGLAVPASADLPTGAQAPLFTTQAALAGQENGFNLRSALAKGPVVLYFYPKAFTKGCTLEANAFAEAMPEFKALGATVVGLSNDDIETLKRFSTEECRDAFAVGVASRRIVEAYDVALVRNGQDTGVTSRTSYLIAQSGEIVMVHSDMDYRDHVRKTLEAVRMLAS